MLEKNSKNLVFVPCIAAPLLLSLFVTYYLSYAYRLVELVMVYGTIMISWFLLYRYLGVVFLGISAIFGFSSYIFIVLYQIIKDSTLSVVGSLFITVLLFLMLVFFLLRTRGIYFAILSLGLNLAIPMLVANIEFSFFRISARILNISEIDRFIGFVLISIIFGFMVGVAVTFPNWKKTYLKLLAIKDDEDGAYSIGLNSYLYRFIMLTILLLNISILGILHTLQLFRVDTSTIFSIDYTTIPFVGGFLASRLGGKKTILIPLSVTLPLFYYFLGISNPGYLELILGLTLIAALFLARKR